MKLPLLGGSTEEFSQDQNFERTINMYPETSKTGRSKLVLYQFPGLSTERTSAASICNIIKFQDDLFLSGFGSITEWYDSNSRTWNTFTDRFVTESTTYDKIKSAKLSDSLFISPDQYIERDSSGNDTIYNIKRFPVQGDQLLSDNSFESASAWTAGTGWTIFPSVGDARASSATGTLDQTVTVDPNTFYVIEIDLQAYTSGNLSVSFSPGNSDDRYYNTNVRDEEGGENRINEMNSPNGDTIVTVVSPGATSATLSIGPDTGVASSVTLTINEIRMYEIGVKSSGFNISSINGYYVKDGENTGQFAISALRDGKTWSSLDQAYMVNEDQEIQHIDSSFGYLWLFGENSIEVWKPSSSIDFPVEYINTISGNVGLLQPFAITKFKDSFAFIGSDLSLYITSGLNIDKVDSKYIIEEMLDLQSTQHLEIVLTYLPYKAHEFICINLGFGSNTFVYDVTTDIWFELDDPYKPILDVILYEFDLGGSAAEEYGYYVCNQGFDMLRLEPDKYTDETGGTIAKTRQSAFIHAEEDPLFFKELVVITNENLNSAFPGVQYSDDGGRNFVAFGDNSYYNGVLKERRLGKTSYGRIFKIIATGDEFIPLIDIYAEVERGLSDD